MQQLKQTAPTADIRGPIIGMMIALLTLGCGGGPRTGVGDDAQGTPDLPASPADLPVERTEYEGIVVGINYHAEPNAAGDVKQPGVCVPYCDPTGEVGPACDGTCVQCSGDNRGLCMQGCSGDDCNVDAFC